MYMDKGGVRVIDLCVIVIMIFVILGFFLGWGHS